jgi:hypothetical protein
MTKEEAVKHMQRFNSTAIVGSTEINAIHPNPVNPELYLIQYVNGYCREVTAALLPAAEYEAINEDDFPF